MNQREAVEALAKWHEKWAGGESWAWPQEWYANSVQANVAALLSNPSCPANDIRADKITKGAIGMTHATIAALVAGAGEKP